MRPPEKKPQLFIILFLVSFASVAAVLYTPGLPAIAAHFNVSISGAQFVVSLFLIGYTFGQLPYGPIANRFGRKPTLYAGILLEIVGAFLCYIFGNMNIFPLFLLSIFLLAVGASVGLKMAFNLIGDSFAQLEAAKRISYMSISFAMAPSIGVVIGGLIVHYLSWQSCFFFLMLYGIYLLSLIPFLPETLPSKDFQALNLKRIFQGFYSQLQSPLLLLGAFVWGLCTCVPYIFAQMGPIIGIEQIGLDPDVYGLYNFIPSFGVLIGALLGKFLFDRIGNGYILALGIAISFIGIVFQIIAFYLKYVDPFTLFFPMVITYIGTTMIFVYASSVAVTGSQDKSNASSVVSFLNMTTALTSTLILSAIPLKFALLLPLFYFVIWVILVLLSKTLIRFSER